MSEISVLTARVDALARGLEATAKGWAERFGLIEREITQAHRWQRDHELETERGKRRRAVSTRIWVALIVAGGTIANGTLQVINSNNRNSLRAEILNEVRGTQAELAQKSANMAVEANNRKLELIINAPR